MRPKAPAWPQPELHCPVPVPEMPNGYDDSEITLVEDTVEVQTAWPKFCRQFELPSFEGLHALVTGDLRAQLAGAPSDAELAYRVLTKLEGTPRERPLEGIEALRQVAACAVVAGDDAAADRLFDAEGIDDGSRGPEDPVAYLRGSDNDPPGPERAPRRLELLEARDLVRQLQETHRSGTVRQPLIDLSVPLAFALADPKKKKDIGIVAWLTIEVLSDGDGLIFADRHKMPLLRMTDRFAQAPLRALAWAKREFRGVEHVNVRWRIKIVKNPMPGLEKTAPFTGPSAFGSFAFALARAFVEIGKKRDEIKANDGALAAALAQIDPEMVAFTAAYDDDPAAEPGTLGPVGDVVPKHRELAAATTKLRVLVVAKGQEGLEGLRGLRPETLEFANLREALLALATRRLSEHSPAPSSRAFLGLVVFAFLAVVGVGVALMRNASSKSPELRSSVPVTSASPIPATSASPIPVTSASPVPVTSASPIPVAEVRSLSPASVSRPPRADEPDQARSAGQPAPGPNPPPRRPPSVIFDRYCQAEVSSLQRMLGDACSPETRCRIIKNSNALAIPPACGCMEHPTLMTTLQAHFSSERCQNIVLKASR